MVLTTLNKVHILISTRPQRTNKRLQQRLRNGRQWHLVFVELGSIYGA